MSSVSSRFIPCLLEIKENINCNCTKVWEYVQCVSHAHAPVYRECGGGVYACVRVWECTCTLTHVHVRNEETMVWGTFMCTYILSHVSCTHTKCVAFQNAGDNCT